MLDLSTGPCVQVVVSSAFESPAGLQSLHHPLAAALDLSAQQQGLRHTFEHGLGTDRWVMSLPVSHSKVASHQQRQMGQGNVWNILQWFACSSQHSNSAHLKRGMHVGCSA